MKTGSRMRRPLATVLTPTPMLTVTVETAGDHDDLHLHGGGQGIWQARMLAALDLDVAVHGVFAGEVGTVLRSLLQAGGIRVGGVDVAGTSSAYVHDRRSGHRHEVARVLPSPLDRHLLDDLYGRFLVDALRSDVVLLAGPDEPGVLPDEVYRRAAADLRLNGRTVVVDLTGDQQAAVLEAGVTALKVSDEELDLEDAPEDAVVRAARALSGRGADQVVVTRSGRPTIAVAGGRSWTVSSPRLEAVDHRGAGDSFTASYAAALARGLAPEEALRRGAAAGALNVVRHGLASGEGARIEELAELVEVVPLDRPGVLR